MKLKRNLTAFSLLLALGACGEDDHDHDHEEEHEHELEEHACVHLQNGPAEALTAAADPSGTLPDVALEHTRVDLALMDDSGSYVGYANFESGEEADIVFFLGANIPFMVFDGSGNEVEIEATEVGSEACTEIAVSHTVELEVGSYTLSFGPTTESSISFVHEEGGEHDHEGHDHE